MDRVVFKVDKVPDLSLSKYQTLSDTGVEGVLERHHTFLRQWNKVCLLNSVSMHLLVQFHPHKCEGKRLEIYFILQGANENLEETAEIIGYSPLSDYYCFRRVSAHACESEYFAGASLIKRERTVTVQKNENEAEEFYFIPEWTVNENARLYDLYKMMTAIGVSAKEKVSSAYRIDLYPTDIAEQTRQAFQIPLKTLQKLDGYGANQISLTQNVRRGEKDGNVRTTMNQMEGWLAQLETTPHYRANIYAFSDSLVHAKMLLGAVGAEALQEGEYTLLKIGSDTGRYDSFCRMEDSPRDYCTSEHVRRNWPSMSGWSTTYTTDEVAPFFRFPALFEGETIELPKETAPPIEECGLKLGVDMNGFDVRFPFDHLSKHAMISGVPGAGKTNTMLHFVSSLWKNERIPFLVFEPAKKEYRGVFNDPEMKEVTLFSPRLGTKFPLRINPFQFPVGMVLSEHINTLMNVFSGSFELQGAVYFFLDQAMENAYLERGWRVDKVNDNSLSYPTLEDVYRLLEQAISATDYDGEIKGNMKSFLQVRLGGLMKRDSGEIFNKGWSTFEPEDWLYRPAIIELEALGEQDKNFLILLLCSLIMESLRVNPNGDIPKKVRHTIFIEEAHNIIAGTSQQVPGSVDPKVSATAYIVKMLAEVRALREAIVITDQLPTALAQEVMKNTGLKIVHRLTAQDDREMIGGTMSASPMQIEALTTYGNGEALLFYEKLEKPFKVKIHQWDYVGAPQGLEAGKRYIPKNNEELFAYLYGVEPFREYIDRDRALGCLRVKEKVIAFIKKEKEEAAKTSTMNGMERVKSKYERGLSIRALLAEIEECSITEAEAMQLQKCKAALESLQGNL